MATCSECGGCVVINDRMEAVCTVCGLVQGCEERAVSAGSLTLHSSPAKRIGVAHGGSLIGFKPADSTSGLREVGPALRAKIARLRQLQKLQPRLGRAEGVVEGERALMRACAHLNLPSSVLWRALHLYRRALSLPQIYAPSRLAKPLLAAACLTIALSTWSHGGVVTSRKVVEVFKELGHRVNFNALSKAVVWIRKALGLRLSSRQPQAYLSFIVEEALSKRIYVSPEVKAEVLKEAMGLLSKLPRRSVGGKAPRILAAAAVYAASKRVEAKLGLRGLVTQKELSQVVGVAEFSIRAHYSKLFKPLLEGAP